MKYFPDFTAFESVESITKLRKQQRRERHPTMMNFQQCTSVALLMLVASCCGHIGGGPIAYQDVSPQVYCGRSLARAFALLCFGEAPEKRSDAGTMYGSILSPYYKEQDNQVGWPWMAPHKARSMGLPSRGKRFVGVVEECCNKACSIEELLSYC